MKVHVVKPRKFNGKAILEGFRGGVDQLARAIEKDLDGTVKTWTNKPKFVVNVSETGKSITIEATTDSKVFGYVDQGTKVRHAVMSRDWISKSKPATGGTARLSSGRGRGKMVIVSRAINRPGIKARKFTQGVLQSNKRDMAQRLEKHLAAGVKRSGHGIK